jgi:arsenical-resistance protein 2
MRSLVLSEGVKGWALAGADFVQQMDEYDESVWTRTGEQ